MSDPVISVPLEGGVELLAVEEPLEIRVEGLPVAVTMRTPGEDQALAVGFLMTEGVLVDVSDLRAFAQVSENVVDFRLHDGVSALQARSADRTLYATSSCGICGKASIERIVRGGQVRGWWPDDAVLASLMVSFEAAQSHTKDTGCMHAAALFDAEGHVAFVFEDVGRHNAVDKALGAWALADQPERWRGLVVTSRGGFEVVQKAITLGLGAVCTVGAPTSLAVEAARAAGLGLVGWLRPGRSRRYR